ncbi:hypothetical protein SIID45300_02324 [Candidatus Magnetaquicoccaceae bacterium FCR-1]|uniref:Glutamine amidotransferase domain-containing protein n=1 Tax=Candidatus Magnetaquiglobus chichijimensis TaxID=3141448 RepID=A0ABQ0CAS3_9PROT
MEIGYLSVGTPPKPLTERFGEYPAMYQRMLADVLPEARLRIFEVREGKLPDSVHTCDGYICPGSDDSVYHPLPWLPPLMAFIRAVHAAAHPFVGICFGHQLLAQSLGGSVERASGGLRLGTRRIEITAPTPWMVPCQTVLHLPFAHRDQVIRLPPDGQTLATSDNCPCAMFQAGEASLGIQGHPEFDHPYMQALIELPRPEKERTEVEMARKRLALDVDNQLVAEWIAGFFRARGSHGHGEANRTGFPQTPNPTNNDHTNRRDR